VTTSVVSCPTNSFSQDYPCKSHHQVARHCTTLATLTNGIVGSKSMPLSKIVPHVPDGNKPESRGKRFAQWRSRFAQWRSNDKIAEEVYFVAPAKGFLAHVALQTLGRTRSGVCRRLEGVVSRPSAGSSSDVCPPSAWGLSERLWHRLLSETL
jgi:hypothetical protein